MLLLLRDRPTTGVLVSIRHFLVRKLDLLCLVWLPDKDLRIQIIVAIGCHRCLSKVGLGAAIGSELSWLSPSRIYVLFR